MRQISYTSLDALIRASSGSLITWMLLSVFLTAQSQPAQLSQAESSQAELSQTESSQTGTSQAEPSTPTSSSELCQTHNTLQQNEQITIGEIPEFPYVVVVPGQEVDLLATVRQCVPDAFQTDSRLGPYIRAASFPNRRSATQLSRHLRRLNLDARVMYLP